MEENTPLVQIRRPEERISQSFPPDTQNNFKFIADVHKQLEKVDLSKIRKIESKISFRKTINESDIEEIKKLHKEWFPLPYLESYYESILKGQVKSIIAEFEISKNVKVIIGCLFYMSKSQKKRFIQFRYKYLLDDYYGVYITTIGVINKFRSIGVASMMMNKLKNVCLNSPLVQYIYLHIVTYNQSGIRYYERNGFVRIETKQNHYDDIEGKKYDAYVYVYYINGASNKVGFLNDVFKCITAPFSSIVDLVKPSHKKLQEGSEQDSFQKEYKNK